MWDTKCMIKPVINGANGIVTKDLKRNMEATAGRHSIESLQKTAILGTSHIIRKVLQCEAGSLSVGDQRWFERRHSRQRRRVTRDNNNNNNNNNNNKQHHNNNVETNLGSGKTTTVICDILPNSRYNCSDISKHCNISENKTCDGNYIYRLLTLL